MGLPYSIFPEHQLVLVKAEGSIRYQDLLNHLRQLEADPEYQSPMKRIVDYTTIDYFRVSFDEGQEVVAYKNSSKSFRGEHAIMVVQDPVVFGQLRQFQSLIDERFYQVDLCPTLEAAFNVVRIRKDEAEQLLGSSLLR